MTRTTLKNVLIAMAVTLLCTSIAVAAEPSFDCSSVRSGSIEALICEDTELVKLDTILSKVYGEASEKAKTVVGSTLQAE